MNFKAPSPVLYLVSLLIAAILAGVTYWILEAQGLTTNIPLVMVIGLVIGHLIGVCALPSTGSSAPTSSAPQQDTASETSDDTISLYVGNLAYSAQRDTLQELFSQYGTVNSVRIMTDRATRRPRGYGFVEMDANSAHTALAQLDNTEFCGRTLRVSEAKQRI